jgi:hypothetical protein
LSANYANPNSQSDAPSAISQTVSHPMPSSRPTEQHEKCLILVVSSFSILLDCNNKRMRVTLLFLGVIATTTTTGFLFTGDNNQKKYTTAFPGLDKLTEKQQGASLQISLAACISSTGSPLTLHEE